MFGFRFRGRFLRLTTYLTSLASGVEVEVTTEGSEPMLRPSSGVSKGKKSMFKRFSSRF